MSIIQQLAMQGFSSILATGALFGFFTYAIIDMDDGPLRTTIIATALATMTYFVYTGGHV